MKTRMSLVSNSSSSSFIVVFPHKPQTEDEIFQFLFNGQDGQIDSCYDDNYHMTHRQISSIAFKDCFNKNKATLKELTEEFSSLVYYEFYKIEEAVKKDDIQAILDIDNFCEDSESITELIKLTRELEQMKKEEDMEHATLRRTFGILLNGQKTDEESQEFKDADIKLRQFWWKKMSPIGKKKQKILDKITKERVQEFINDHKGWWYTILNYEDHSPEGSFMEHQNVFRHVENIQICHH